MFTLLRTNEDPYCKCLDLIIWSQSRNKKRIEKQQQVGKKQRINKRDSSIRRDQRIAPAKIQIMHPDYNNKQEELEKSSIAIQKVAVIEENIRNSNKAIYKLCIDIIKKYLCNKSWMWFYLIK